VGAVDIFEILHSGFLTTIQDLGRIGYGCYGVPASGAMDPFALRLGNLLVGNPETAAGLEITLPGLRLKVLNDAVAAVTGADLGCRCNGKPLRQWHAHHLQTDDILEFEELNHGCRAYLAVGGGLAVPAVLGSKSTNLGSGFGGLDGRPLRRGDVLEAEAPYLHLECQGRGFDLNSVPGDSSYRQLRVLPGPQFHHFSQAAVDRFLNSDYRVSPHSDRTGIRLQGEGIAARNGLPESIISEGIVAGAVQLPGDGQPIIILNETVSGGYRKIAVVIAADLHLLGQLLPGDVLRFQAVDLREAREALWRLEEKIARLRNALQ
jgi:antagonist of KipI